MIDKKGDLDQSATRRGRGEITPETFTHQEDKAQNSRKICNVSLKYRHGYQLVPWELTICTNYLGGNLTHKHKAKKFYVLGQRPATKYIQIS